MKRKQRCSIWLSSIAVIVLTLGIIVACDSKDAVYRTWEKTSISDFKTKGGEFLLAGNPDSALFYSTLAARKYTADLPDSLKLQCARACNNMGYVYFYYYNDYQSSYSSLLRAEEIVLETDSHDMLSYVYLNIGNIYTSYQDYAISHEYYRKAFYAAVESMDPEPMLTVLDNLLAEIRDSSDVALISDIIETFDSLELPHVRMADYTRKLCEATDDIATGRYDAAIDKIESAKVLIDTDYTPERFRM